MGNYSGDVADHEVTRETTLRDKSQYGTKNALFKSLIDTGNFMGASLSWSFG